MFQETLLQQVCDDCSNMIINIYILMQRHSLKKKALIKIVESLEKEIMNIRTYDEKCYLRCITDVDQTDTEKLSLNSHKDCPKCDMKFESEILLQEHNGIAHKTRDKALLCHTCGKVCKTPQALKDHLNCHNEKQCPYCSKMLKTYSYYRRHVQNHNSEIKKKRAPSYTCNECKYISFNKSSLEAHINKVHLRVRPHVCPVCLKGFFKKSNLTDHIHIHEKVKTETCEVCGDSFSCKKSLMWHLRLHNKETPYECHICSKKFVTSGRRHEHVKRKHMEKSESCLFCNKMFSLKRELNRHVKIYHLEKKDSNVNNVGS